MMNPPRVVIENNAYEKRKCHCYSVLQVDSVNRNGILLDFVQVISDMNLVISNSKGLHLLLCVAWFMDVFNVIEDNGNKIRDKDVVGYIQRVGI